MRAGRLGVRFLSDLTDLGATSRLTDPVLRGQARHVLSDNQRVLKAAGLLSEAHESLRDDFEVSWPEADVAVAAARTRARWGPG